MPVMPDALQAARWLLARERPYLSAALWALVPVATEACMAPVIRREWFLPPEERPQDPAGTEEPVVWVPTMSVDRWWRLYFHPQVADIYSVDELARMLYHELSHVLRDHASRALELRAQPLVANVAQDIAINQDLREDGDFAPPHSLLPEYFRLPPGLTWEAYYEILQKRLPKKGTKGDGFPFPFPGADSGSPSRGSGPSPAVGPQARVGGRRSRPLQAGPGAGQCGSAAHGQPMPWELPGPEEGEKDGQKIPAGRGQVEGDLIRRTVAQEMVAYKGRGTLPGGWLRWAEEILAGNRPDWRRLLAAAIRRGLAQSAGRMDYSFLRPNRRHAVYYPAVLPGMVRPDLDVAVVIDTSGSTTEKELGLALGALRDLIRTVTGDGGRGIRVLSCDAAASQAQRVFSPRNVQLYGGGGTDMRVGIEAACKLRPKPGVVVVFTDGLTPWPEQPPEVPTVIALVGEGDVETPAWATVVRISVEEHCA